MDTMNTGQYQNRPQISGLLADDFQYDEYDGDLESSNQASHPMFPWFDGLPRTPSQHFMNNTSSSANILSSNYNSLLQPIPMSQASIPWEDPNQSSGGFQDNNTTSFYGYSASNIPVNGHNGSFLQGSTYQQQVPRFMPNMFGMNDNNISLEESYAPSSYLLDSARNGLQHSPTRDSPFENQHLSNARDLQRMSISNSPIPKMEQEDSRLDFSSFERPPPFGLPSSETSDEGNSSREMTAVEAEDQDEINEPSPDEPYAKLIHRALMSAPTKSMVLQEIYQWFRDNTQKGGAESKGWMNSIRHNLSMNAVSPLELSHPLL